MVQTDLELTIGYFILDLVFSMYPDWRGTRDKPATVFLIPGLKTCTTPSCPLNLVL